MATSSPSVPEIVQIISDLRVKELMVLTKSLREEFDLPVDMPIAFSSAAPGASAPQQQLAEEKTEFTVKMTSFGSNKISVIKVIRELVPSLNGLKEAKEFVESVERAPVLVKEHATKADADAVKKKLEEAGATAVIE